MDVYVHKDGQQYGPYTIEQIHQFVQAGHFTVNDYACSDGQNWITITQVLGIAPVASPTNQPVSSAGANKSQIRKRRQRPIAAAQSRHSQLFDQNIQNPPTFANGDEMAAHYAGGDGGYAVFPATIDAGLKIGWIIAVVIVLGMVLLNFVLEAAMEFLFDSLFGNLTLGVVLLILGASSVYGLYRLRNPTTTDVCIVTSQRVVSLLDIKKNKNGITARRKIEGSRRGIKAFRYVSLLQIEPTFVFEFGGNGALTLKQHRFWNIRSVFKHNVMRISELKKILQNV